MPESERREAPLPYGGLVPHDTFCEMWTLASVLLEGAPALEQVRPFLRASDFYREDHAHIYAAMLALDDRGLDPNIVQVAHELLSTGLLDEAGGESYIVRLGSFYLVGAGHLLAAARTVRWTSDRRAQIQHAGRLATDAYLGAGEPRGVIDEGWMARYSGGIE